MASKGTKVTAKEVQKMIALYSQYGSYAKVARKMRRSPSTVSKYVGRSEAIEQVGYYFQNLLEKEE